MSDKILSNVTEFIRNSHLLAIIMYITRKVDWYAVKS